MKIGYQTFKFNYPGGAAEIAPRLKEAAILADQGGFADFWLVDHFFQMEMAGPYDEAMLEAYTTLGYLAAVTQNIRLGTLVTGVIYRYPAFLVKTVSTLDVLSQGRAWLGIGAAWYERESLGLGFPFPPLAQRFEMLEETLQIIHQMWRGDRYPYHGRHYQLAEPVNTPQPLATPHPPILIGGKGEKKTLRLVAQYADACNFDYDIGADEIRRKLDILREHCQQVGTDYDRILKTVVGRGDDKSSQALIDLCGGLAEAGVQQIMLNMPTVTDLKFLERLASEVIPVVAEF